MMKKVLYGVALTLFAGVSVGSLQSCKDDMNDIATQTSYDLSNLRAQLAGLAARVDQNAADISKNAADIRLKADITWVQSELDKIAQQFGAVNDRIDVVAGNITDLQAETARLGAAIDQITNQLGDIDGRIDALQTAYDDLVNSTNASIADLTSRVEYLEAQRELMQNELDALKEYVEGLPTQADLEEVYLAIEATNEYLSQVYNSLMAEIGELDEALRAQLAAQMETIMNAIDGIVSRLDKNVSGILIQGVYSPVFGDFSLPLGIRSNILFGWYGLNDRDEAITFPSNINAFNANGDVNVDFNKLYPATYTVNPGFYGDELDRATLGKVYVTINPVNAQLGNLQVQLETSSGAVLPWPVTLKPSDYEIAFGLGSRSEDNGFYEGEVIVPIAEARQQIGIEIEDGLENAVKDALKTPNRNTAKALVKAVYDQLNGKLPAYAVRYSWNSALDEIDPGFSGNSYSAVLSQYDLAVATAKPLSYNTLKGYHGDRQIPEIGHISNLLDKIREEGGKLKFDFGEPFTVEGFTVDLGSIEFETVEDNLVITIPGVLATDENGQLGIRNIVVSTENGGIEGMDDLIKSIEDAIVKALGEASDDLNENVAKMVDSINSSVQEMFDTIDSQINGKIDEMVNDVTNKLEPYFGRIDRAIDIFNKVIEKVNNFLADPNAYLQVTAFYNMNGGLGMVSGRLSDPTPFNKAGGNYFKLYLSSYTGELIVPAAKKYVAVTGVYKNGVRQDVNLDALNKKANKEKFNNGLLDGNEIVVLADAAAFEEGNVYEFTYQALDFRGYTSTKKFYIEVK